MAHFAQMMALTRGKVPSTRSRNMEPSLSLCRLTLVSADLRKNPVPSAEDESARGQIRNEPTPICCRLIDDGLAAQNVRKYGTRLGHAPDRCRGPTPARSAP